MQCTLSNHLYFDLFLVQRCLQCSLFLSIGKNLSVSWLYTTVYILSEPEIAQSILPLRDHVIAVLKRMAKCFLKYPRKGYAVTPPLIKEYNFLSFIWIVLVSFYVFIKPWTLEERESSPLAVSVLPNPESQTHLGIRISLLIYASPCITICAQAGVHTGAEAGSTQLYLLE